MLEKFREKREDSENMKITTKKDTQGGIREFFDVRQGDVGFRLLESLH
jgi:hypothetical protein